MAGKLTQGRLKIQLKKIENEAARTVTFSKRQSGLFKKANELATLCGAQIAVILLSITGKPVSFGSPSLQSVLNRFFNMNQVHQHEDGLIREHANDYHEAELNELNQQFNELNEQMAKEKQRGKTIPDGIKTYEDYIGSLDIHGLRQLKDKMEEMKRSFDHNDDEASGVSSFKPMYEVDFSKLGVPKDYLKL